MALNAPIGSDLEAGNPINNTDEQSVEPETCMYCGDPTHEYHRDKDGNIICVDCVQAELENNINFKFT